MLLEFAAARMLAPWFGTSLLVWGSIIGVVLLALSFGYWYGGRLADRYPQADRLMYLTLAAGVTASIIPIILHIFLDNLSLSITLLSGTYVGTLLGSFGAMLLALAVPIGLLGMVSPYVIRLVTTDITQSGQVAGALYAWSTVGSIVGTFASAFVLVPWLGSRETITLAAASLIVVGVIGLPNKAKFSLWLALPLAIYGYNSIRPLHADAATLYSTESTYQFIRVEDQGDRLALIFNEGLGTQSYYMKTGVLTGSYFDYAGLTPELTQLPSQPNLAVLGLAGGTVTRQLREYYPQATITGVEIDPAVITAAQKYFHLDEQAINLVNQDARQFLHSSHQRYDVLVIDAYANEHYIPWHLTTKEFFHLAANRLSPRGILAMNIGSIGEDTDIFQALVATVASEFKIVAVIPVPSTYNYVVVASNSQLQPNNLQHITGARFGLAKQALAGFHFITTTDTDKIFTDNRAPLELYTEQMIWSYITSLW